MWGPGFTLDHSMNHMLGRPASLLHYPIFILLSFVCLLVRRDWNEMYRANRWALSPDVPMLDDIISILIRWKGKGVRPSVDQVRDGCICEQIY